MIIGGPNKASASYGSPCAGALVSGGGPRFAGGNSRDQPLHEVTLSAWHHDPRTRINFRVGQVNIVSRIIDNIVHRRFEFLSNALNGIVFFPLVVNTICGRNLQNLPGPEAIRTIL